MRTEHGVYLALMVSILVLSGCRTPASTTTVTTTTTECEAREDDSGEPEAPKMRECTTINEETVVSHGFGQSEANKEHDGRQQTHFSWSSACPGVRRSEKLSPMADHTAS